MYFKNYIDYKLNAFNSSIKAKIFSANVGISLITFKSYQVTMISCITLILKCNQFLNLSHIQSQYNTIFTHIRSIDTFNGSLLQQWMLLIYHTAVPIIIKANREQKIGFANSLILNLKTITYGLSQILRYDSLAGAFLDPEV